MNFFRPLFITFSVRMATTLISGCTALDLPSFSEIDHSFEREIPVSRQQRSLRGKKNKKKKTVSNENNERHAYPQIPLIRDDNSGDSADLLVSHARIINGSDASHQYHHFILLMNGNTPVGCGAVLIDKRFVLTAAHCMRARIDSVYINAYAPWEDNRGYAYQVEEVSDTFLHPGYDEHTFDNDFAILKLQSEVNDEFPPIKLPRMDTTYQAADSFTALGFGRMSKDVSFSKILQETTVGYVPNEQCKTIPGFRDTIKDSMLCAGGGDTDACTGDSGGPLIRETSEGPELVGIVSWGFGCATVGIPGVYGRVQSALTWIHEIICSSDSKSESVSELCNENSTFAGNAKDTEAKTIVQPEPDKLSTQRKSCTSIDGEYTYEQVKNGKTRQKTRSCDSKNTAKLCGKSVMVQVHGESLPLVEVCPEECEASWCE